MNPSTTKIWPGNQAIKDTPPTPEYGLHGAARPVGMGFRGSGGDLRSSAWYTLKFVSLSLYLLVNCLGKRRVGIHP
jgi:hypothetical protein